MEQKKASHKKLLFRGIGESDFITDFAIGVIPVIHEEDSEEIKRLKHHYIRRKLGGMRALHMTP
jgi:hypothetical protein